MLSTWMLARLAASSSAVQRMRNTQVNLSGTGFGGMDVNAVCVNISAHCHSADHIWYVLFHSKTAVMQVVSMVFWLQAMSPSRSSHLTQLSAGVTFAVCRCWYIRPLPPPSSPRIQTPTHPHRGVHPRSSHIYLYKPAFPRLHTPPPTPTPPPTSTHSG